MVSLRNLAGKSGDAEDVASASTVEEALAFVGDWLERFAALDP